MGYDFDSIINRRGTSSLKWDFEQKHTGSTGLLPLWVADMDFTAPREIVDAIRQRVEHGIFGYTLEPDSYFEAAASWLERRHGWSVRRDWMVASSGVIPSLTAAILALTRPGDGVVIQPPVYHPFALRIAGNGRRVVENPLALSGMRWDMDLEGLARVVDNDTRMLVLCSPHNPVSRVWERDTLARLGDFCGRRGIVIVSDEIHCDLVMRGHRHVPLASVSEAAASNSVTLMSATKTFNLAGLGGSLTIIPDAGLRERFNTVHRAVFAGTANAIAVPAAEAAWRNGGRWLDELLEYIEENCLFMTRYLAEHLPAAKVFPLEGTYLALIDMRSLGLTDEELKERLLRVAGVWLDEGVKFGRGGEGFQRLNLACPSAILAEALERIVRALGE
ncbi:MAG: MalY/PatB family protein [Spirochaetia bacterium]|jgi:cystathionine beta-lyase